eukprot:3870137-Heterocapsa_arctica.AAC.1
MGADPTGMPERCASRRRWARAIPGLLVAPAGVWAEMLPPGLADGAGRASAGTGAAAAGTSVAGASRRAS